MRRTHPAGIYEAVVEAPMRYDGAAPYAIRVESTSGGHHDHHDPYAFSAMLTDYDLHLLGEGRHWRSYEKLGAQLHAIDGVAGVNFAVWAPNADAVSVVGDFNGWDTGVTPMQRDRSGRTWSARVPLEPGRHEYAFVVDGQRWVVDPLAPQVPDAGFGPTNAVVVDIEGTP